MIYLINTKTREHIDAVALGDAEYERLAGSSGWIFQMADTDGWIEWHGGECPMPDGAPCDVKHKDGDEFFNQRAGVTDNPPGGFAEDWSHEARYFGGDIIAYRPIFDAGNKVSHPGRMSGPDKFRAVGGEPPVGAYVEYPTGRGVVKLPPDRDGVTVVEDDGSKCAGEAGTYKRVAACACEPIRSEEDRVVEQMAMDLVEKDADAEYSMDGLRALYHAGYRKTGGEW